MGTTEPAQKGREVIARLAEAEGHHEFAGQVRGGCWDHRNDVQSAIRDPEGFRPRKLEKPR